MKWADLNRAQLRHILSPLQENVFCVDTTIGLNSDAGGTITLTVQHTTARLLRIGVVSYLQCNCNKRVVNTL